MPRLLPLVALLGIGCKADPGDTDPGDTDPGDSDVPAGPCADGGWGAISDASAAIHVRADGVDTGAGDVEHPVASLATALTLARAAGLKAIAVGPGTFPASLDLEGDLGGGLSDDGFAIAGCGDDETVLEAATSRSHVIRVTDAAGVRLEGFAIVGGRRSLWIWGGSTTVQGVSVAGATRSGIMMDGSNNLTEVTLDDVHVDGVSADTDGSFGYGIAIQDATVTLTNTDVTAATRVGILIDGAFASATLDAVSVADTAVDDDGRFGRGVQVQSLSEARLAACAISGNADAGLFALQAVSLDVADSVVTGVDAATTPDGATTGDGLVVTQGSDYEYAASTFVASLDGNTVTAPDRAGILLAGVTVDLTDNTITGPGFAPDGFGVLSQGPVEITGDTAAVYDLEAAAATLAVDEDLLTSDDLLE